MKTKGLIKFPISFLTVLINGQSMAHAMTGPESVAVPAPMAKLAQLKEMHDAGLITDEDYAAKKKDILDKF